MLKEVELSIAPALAIYEQGPSGILNVLQKSLKLRTFTLITTPL